MTSTEPTPRRETRYLACGGASLEARILILAGEGFDDHPCHLTDISTGGCAVRAALPEMRAPLVAVIEIRDPADGSTLQVAGRVCWKQKTSLGSDSYGFHFRRPLQAETIDRLIQHGCVTRRQAARIACQERIQVRRAHGKPPLVDVVLEDVSNTGVRLSIDQPLDINEQVLLTIGDPENAVSGTISVVWVSHRDGQLQCGGTFSTLKIARQFNERLAVSC